jgi:hypothetical protein
MTYGGNIHVIGDGLRLCRLARAEFFGCGEAIVSLSAGVVSGGEKGGEGIGIADF